MDILLFLGGLGLFLYGMKVLGDALEKTAGARMEQLIEKVTGSLFKSVLVGASVTAIIQSSSATTVMLVGFVNSGIMTLKQATGVIMGANIGTTATSQIISFSQTDHSIWLNLLKPTTIAPLCVAIGTFCVLFSSSSKVKAWAEVAVGFGILFIGMRSMEQAVSSFATSEQFKGSFNALGANPLLGLLAGTAVTAILQSSSASIGILQATAQAGLITYGGAIPVILGQNIGTCVTALLASIGASKTAKRAAFVHLYFNLLGTIVFMVGFYAANALLQFGFWDDIMPSYAVANFHTSFNIITTLVLLPFTKLLIWLATHTLANDSQPEVHAVLDERLLTTPTIAASVAFKETLAMGKIANEAFVLSCDILDKQDNASFKTVLELEDQTDIMESAIARYLVKLVELSLSDQENLIVSNLLHTITDFERIGDHARSIAQSIVDFKKDNVEMSPDAVNELSVMMRATKEIVRITLKAFEETNDGIAKRIQPLEDVVDHIRDTLKQRHVDRLTRQLCNVKSGVVFLDLIGNLERISDHCSNIGFRIEQQCHPHRNVDQHAFKNIPHNQDPDFDSFYKEYSSTFSV